MKTFYLTVSIFVLPFFSSNGIQAQTVTDYDGNVYDTVNIGTQVWMKQNLKVTHYSNGSALPNVTDSAAWVNLLTGARCYYNNDSLTYDSVYGALYNWYAVNDINGICPEGWHVSTDADWQMAEAYLGGVDIAGSKMKEAGTSHWASPNNEATNSSGFTGLPGGMRDPDSKFGNVVGFGMWWANTEFNTSFVWSTYMWNLATHVDHNPIPKNYALSIRCVKDIGSGLIDINKNEIVKIFPNPAINKLFIECTENQDFKMQIYNITGGCVMQNQINDLSEEIDISSLSKGTYVIEFLNADWRIHKKLIKE